MHGSAGSVVLVGANCRSWVSAVRHLYGLLAVGIWSPPATAPSPNRFAPPYPHPPYLETNVREYMVSMFEAERAAIQSLLPPGVQAASTNTVGISHYIIEDGAGSSPGLAPFQATFIFAEVEGRDDPSGGKGRHMLWGLYSEDLALAALAGVLGLPMETGTTAFAESGGGVRGAGLSEGKEVIVSGINPKGDGPVTLGGVLHYPWVRQKAEAIPSPELVIQSVAWTAKVRTADLVSVKLNFPESHRMNRLKPKKLLYAYFGRDVNFEFGDVPKESW
ncbi:MAG: hypothetical protein EXR36_10130 [Betaproteobacteria bacterium]|nr:hypothetical protein [Betaproteobacteria bacterium]